MKKLLGLILSFFVYTSIQAQNYTPVRYGWTYQYAAGNRDTLVTLRVDTAYVAGTDSVYELDKKIFQKYQPSEFEASVTNVFGKKIVKSVDNEFGFILLNNDTLVLKTQVSIGSSWVFSKGRNLTATLTARTMENVLGVADSVITFSISNGKQVQLSKHYGLLNTTTLFEYIPPQTYDSFINFNSLSLDAIKEPKRGLYVQDPLVINNFEVGDVFGKIEKIDTTGVVHKEKVLSKTLINDSVVYTIEKTYATRSSKDTIRVVVYAGQDKAIYQQLTYSFVSGYPDDEELILNQIIFDHELQKYTIVTSPLYLVVRLAEETGAQSTVGLGLTYFYTYDGNGGSREEKLLCFKKQDESYGDCDDLVAGVDDEQLAELIKVGPNPATNEINVTNSSGASFNLINLQGITVQSGTLLTDTETINIADLSTGFYVLRLQSNANKLLTKKVLIMR